VPAVRRHSGERIWHDQAGVLASRSAERTPSLGAPPPLPGPPPPGGQSNGRQTSSAVRETKVRRRPSSNCDDSSGCDGAHSVWAWAGVRRGTCRRCARRGDTVLVSRSAEGTQSAVCNSAGVQTKHSIHWKAGQGRTMTVSSRLYMAPSWQGGRLANMRHHVPLITRLCRCHCSSSARARRSLQQTSSAERETKVRQPAGHSNERETKVRRPSATRARPGFALLWLMHAVHRPSSST
jgi:hypothetical protein